MKVYLDSCVFIVYVEKEISNSRIIMELAERGISRRFELGGTFVESCDIYEPPKFCYH